MERTKRKDNEEKKFTMNEFQVLASAIVGRASLAAKLGYQYGTSRDLYEALGYKTTLTYTDFLAQYTRQDMAKAIIDRPVRATWQGVVELIESDEEDDTALEQEWKDLDRELGIKTILSRVDRLTGIGEYGVLLLGLDDVSSPDKFKDPVRPGVRKLHYVKPFGQDSAQIESYVIDTKDKRYGLPLIYSIQVADVSSGHSTTVQVHYSRVIHITDDPLESEVKGTPRLEAVFNRLMDLEKIVGGDAEMFWRGARPGFEGKVDPEYQMTKQMKAALQDQLDEYEHGLRRFLVNEGIDLKALAQQISDPKGHFDVQIACLSAVTGIPQRILTGSERGELASTQDTSEWKEYVIARRGDHAEPHIVRPFVDKLIELKILSAPTNDYTVKWSDLYAMSEKSKIEVGKGRANALREYSTNPIAMEIVPPAAFFELFCGLDTEQITLITKMRDAGISEDDLMDDILKLVDPPEPKPIPAGKPIPAKKPIAK